MSGCYCKGRHAKDALFCDLFAADTGAEFSSCKTYRYRLWRIWDDGPRINYIMLNPSTADDVKNDPTVERCQRRAAMLGFGSLVVTNLFAMRSTDPKNLYAAEDPVGPRNDSAILAAAKNANLVLCGWGNHGALNGRGAAVAEMLREARVAPHCLRITKPGHPEHPLYIPYSRQPQVLWSKGVS